MDEIMRRVREGDPTARSELIDALRVQLGRDANNLLGEKLRAQYGISDIVQSTCLEICERIEGFKGEQIDDVHRWARLLMRNNIRRKARFHAAKKRNAGQRAEPLVDGIREQSTPSVQALHREELTALLPLMTTIKAEDRELLYACIFASGGAREVAREFGYAESKVRSRVARARAVLLMEARRRGLLGDN
jgi:RNA polymerase sigma factor (sigma-70 family)